MTYRTIKVDFNTTPPSVETYGGESGEIGAVHLEIVPEDAMLENPDITSFNVLFETSEGTQSSAVFGKEDAPFDVSLWYDITKDSTTVFQLVAQNSQANVVMKTPTYSLWFEQSIDDSEIVTPGTTPSTIIAQIAEFREDLVALDNDLASHKVDVNAHADIRADITAEQSERISADTLLQDGIDTEAIRRFDNDNILQYQINQKYEKPRNGIPYYDLDYECHTMMENSVEISYNKQGTTSKYTPAQLRGFLQSTYILKHFTYSGNYVVYAGMSGDDFIFCVLVPTGTLMLAGYKVSENRSISRYSTIDMEFVPSTRTVNGYELASNITLNASDVNAYTQAEVNSLISAIQKVTIQIVETLPETGESNVIYFVPRTESEQGNTYDEYIYISTWEKIGSTDVDLSNYYTKTETDTLLSAKQDVLEAGEGIDITGNVISATGGSGAVSSVNGQTGDVVLAAGDIDYDADNTVEEAISQAKADIIKMFDKKTLPFSLTANKFIKASNGTVQDAVSGYYASSYVDVTGCLRIKIFTALISTAGIAFYNDSKAYISDSGITYATGYSGRAYTYEIDVPTDAKYVRFSVYTYNSGVTPTTASITDDFKNFKQLEADLNSKASISSVFGTENIPFTLTNAKAIRYTTGAEEVSSTNYNASNYVDISKCTKLKLFTAFQGNFGCAFYSESYANLGMGITYATGYNGTAYEYEIVPPPHAKYMRFTVYTYYSGVTANSAYLKNVVENLSEVQGSFREIEEYHNDVITNMPKYMKGLLHYRPIGHMQKGYICMTADDGNSSLATYTIPMLMSKQVPCTFGLYSGCDVITHASLLQTLLSALDAGSVVAVHGTTSWSVKSEYYLDRYFDNIETEFANAGISNVYGAICPGQQGYADTSTLIQCVAGGRYGVVCSGGANGEISYGDYHCAGDRTNIFAVNRESVIRLTENKYKEAIDYAYDNNLVFMPFWHDYEVAGSEAYQEILEGMIDYAKEKGLEFITLKDLPNIV